MKIRFGYELVYDCVQPNALMILMLHAHPSRGIHDLLRPDDMRYTRMFPSESITTDSAILARASKAPRRADQDHHGRTHQRLRPTRTGLPLRTGTSGQFRCPRRPCNTCSGAGTARPSALMPDAWRLFGHLAPGWNRVQAICDFAHQHVMYSAITSRAPPRRRTRRCIYRAAGDMPRLCSI